MLETNAPCPKMAFGKDQSSTPRRDDCRTPALGLGQLKVFAPTDKTLALQWEELVQRHLS